MKLSAQAIIRLAQALQSFDGLNDIQDGKPVKVSFKIDARVRMTVAKNIARLQEVLQAYQKTRNGLIYSHAEPGKNEVAPDKLADFEKQDRLLLDELHEVDVVTLTEEQLKLDVNAIPVSTLAALMPILAEAEPARPPKSTNGAAEHANAN